MPRRIALDGNGGQLLEGLVVIVRLDKRLGMKVIGNEIEIGS